MTNKRQWIFQIKLHIPINSSDTCAHAHIQFLYSDTHHTPHTITHNHYTPTYTNCTVCGQLYLHKSGLSRHMQSHQQQQPSTCGQCGKTFNHVDNLGKHPRHCTGHKQQLPPPQQQTAAPSSPKFTIHHQYSSMGGAVECYNIDVQETQHLVQLSTTLLPTMKQFHTKHNIPCGSERCHTTTSYPNFGNDCCVCSIYRTTTR